MSLTTKRLIFTAELLSTVSSQTYLAVKIPVGNLKLVTFGTGTSESGSVKDERFQRRLHVRYWRCDRIHRLQL